MFGLHFSDWLHTCELVLLGLSWLTVDTAGQTRSGYAAPPEHACLVAECVRHSAGQR